MGGRKEEAKGIKGQYEGILMVMEMFCILTEQCQYHVCDTGCTTVLQMLLLGKIG